MRLYHAGLAILYYAWVCHSSVVAIRFDSKKTGCGQIMPDSATARVMEIASYLLAILSCDTVGKFVSSFVFFFLSPHLISPHFESESNSSNAAEEKKSKFIDYDDAHK